MVVRMRRRGSRGAHGVGVWRAVDRRRARGHREGSETRQRRRDSALEQVFLILWRGRMGAAREKIIRELEKAGDAGRGLRTGDPQATTNAMGAARCTVYIYTVLTVCIAV